MLRDRGAILDWATSWTTEKKWKCARANIGPGFDRLVALHPDTAKQVLQKRTHQRLQLVYITLTSSHSADPKDDLLYHALIPWLGEWSFQTSSSTFPPLFIKPS